MRFILPVRGLGRGKTRLAAPAAVRDRLTVAMLRDCLAAVRATGAAEVVVVSPDPSIREVAVRDGALALDHPGGLNDAIRAAVVPGVCAALLPDLPALQPDHLHLALTGRAAGFVADVSGTGTTLLFGPDLQPAFGPGSAARHEAAGYQRIDLPECGLRVDVDTAVDLVRAQRLGVGPHTARALAWSGADPAVRIGP